VPSEPERVESEPQQPQFEPVLDPAMEARIQASEESMRSSIEKHQEHQRAHEQEEQALADLTRATPAAPAAPASDASAPHHSHHLGMKTAASAVIAAGRLSVNFSVHMKDKSPDEFDEEMRLRFQRDVAEQIRVKTGGKVVLRPEQVVITSARAGSLIIDVQIVGLDEAEHAETIGHAISMATDDDPLVPHGTYGASLATGVEVNHETEDDAAAREAAAEAATASAPPPPAQPVGAVPRVYEAQEVAPRTSQAVVSATAAAASETISTEEQRRSGKWANAAPRADDVLELEAEIAAKEALAVAAQERKRRVELERQQDVASELEEEGAQRREQYAEEDRALMLNLEEENRKRQQDRQRAQLQLATEVDEAERKLVDAGLAAEFKAADGMAEPVTTMPPTDYREPPDLPSAFGARNNLDSIFDKMQEEEVEAKRMGIMRLDDYEKVKREISAPQLMSERALLAMIGCA